MIKNLLFATHPFVPEKIAFSIGSFHVAWYGIFIFIGFIIAIILACIKLSKWYKIPYDPFFYFVIIGIPVAILGARTWSFIIGDAKITTNFFYDFWQFASGGLAIQGGIIATTITGLIYFPLILRRPKYNVKTKKNEELYVRQISTWVYADAIIPCVLIGQIIGRWGNFTNQELYGSLVDNPEISMYWLKVFMPDVYYGMFINGDINNFHQPLFLYESFANFVGFFIIFVGFEFIKKRKAGDLAMSYFIFYGIVRLIMEPLRSSEFYFVTSIVSSVIFIIAGIALVLINHLVIVKKRNFKFFYYLWTNTIFIFKKIYSKFNKEFAKTLLLKDPELKNLGFKNKPIFIRKEEELLYYNGY